jgi:coenzyme F420-reducing hydrogenase gamma subunit
VETLFGADMTPRAIFIALILAFGICAVCAGVTTSRTLHHQASSAKPVLKA